MDRRSDRITKLLYSLFLLSFRFLYLPPLSSDYSPRSDVTRHGNSVQQLAVLTPRLERERERESKTINSWRGQCCQSPVIPFPYWIFLSPVLLIVQLSRCLSYWRHSLLLFTTSFETWRRPIYTSAYTYIFKKNRLFVGNGNFQVV